MPNHYEVSVPLEGSPPKSLNRLLLHDHIFQAAIHEENNEHDIECTSV
jgi:hypothetical protein